MSHRITGRVTGQRKGRKNLVNIIMYLKASRVSRCYINAFMYANTFGWWWVCSVIINSVTWLPVLCCSAHSETKSRGEKPAQIISTWCSRDKLSLNERKYIRLLRWICDFCDSLFLFQLCSHYFHNGGFFYLFLFVWRKLHSIHIFFNGSELNQHL